MVGFLYRVLSENNYFYFEKWIPQWLEIWYSRENSEVDRELQADKQCYVNAISDWIFSSNFNELSRNNKLLKLFLIEVTLLPIIEMSPEKCGSTWVF